MIDLKFPDGAVRQYPEGSTARDVATSISPSLAKKAVLAELNGEQRDMGRVLETGGDFRLIMRDDPAALYTIRHDTAHVLAEGVQTLFPGTQVTIGPAIEIRDGVIENPKIAAQAIAAYRAAGVRISIDDYGAGLSSLSYLKMLNADELKIDRSLILDVVESARDRLIIKSTVDLAHGLGMTVVAEGVETGEVFDTLAALGCDTIQGYWVSRPLPFDDLITFFATSGVEERQLLVG